MSHPRPPLRSSATNLFLLLLVLLGASCASTNREATSQRQASRDYTFFLCSDVHVGAENTNANPPFTRAETLAKITANLEAMRALPGRTYPDRPQFAGLNPDIVAMPRGLIILGDLTDGHKEPARQEEQWQSFDTLFPGQGVSIGGQTVPVFASAGNHDGSPRGPTRQGLVRRHRAANQAGRLAAISRNGVHFALNWEGVHLVSLNLCPADTTDAETPFKYGKPGPGSWNDPQGALSFLKNYLTRKVGRSGEPVILMHHYGFDGFSINDWYWWTPKQRRALYDAIKPYNIVAFFHGHDHHADHYRWPDRKRHAEDLEKMFPEGVPADLRQYDVVSCGNTCWVMRVKGDQLAGIHFRAGKWADEPSLVFRKSLLP